jgi:hypothetical protein
MSRWGRVLGVCAGVAMMVGGLAELAGYRLAWMLVAAAAAPAGASLATRCEPGSANGSGAMGLRTSP